MDKEGWIVFIVLFLITALCIYLFPELLRMNPWTMNKRITALEQRIK